MHFAGLLKPWRQPRIAAFASKDYVETLREAVPEHRLDRSPKSRLCAFYDRRLRQFVYPVESFIWQQRRGF